MSIPSGDQIKGIDIETQENQSLGNVLWMLTGLDQTSNDLVSAHSCRGFTLMYAGCPIIWGSKLQSLIALSHTEAEYIALSTAL